MHFHKSIAGLLILAVSTTLSLPTSVDGSAKLVARALAERPYSEIQISDGVAGNAAAEAKAKFPVYHS
jgi:hypothetical protein